MHYKLKIIIIILSLKLIYISFGILYIHSQNINVSHLEDFTSLFCKNDCGWYKGIVENGYESTLNFEDSIKIDANNYRQSEWAFFPLYPFFIKYGWLWMFSGFPTRGDRYELMAKTWELVKKYYE
jgi:hypothetical protein